jgi:hypothetical protein
VIDIRYWYYEGNGKLYAPLGGQWLAPRQEERIYKPKAPTFDQVYRAVHEYRVKYPAKAVLYSADGYDHFGWAVFIAGGSLPALPANTDKQFLTAASFMQPVELAGDTKDEWALGGNKGYIVYSNSGNIRLDLDANANYRVKWVDPKTGTILSGDQQIKGGKDTQITNTKGGEAILWLTRI